MRLQNRIVVAMVLFASVVSAQVGQQGSITGTVTDVRRDPIIGQPVLVRNKATKSVYEAPLGPKGEYQVVVPAGTYELVIPRVTQDYFRYAHKGDIAVQAGATVRVDIVDVPLANLATIGDAFGNAVIRNKYAGKVKGPTPRINGKLNLSGMWSMAGPVVFEENADPVLTPWAETVAQARRKDNMKDMPSANCLPYGPLPIAVLPVRVIQSPTHLMLLVEGEPVVRQVFLDGRPHPADLDPTWMGHSVGQWEGDTLVVDTVGFNDQMWFPPGGVYPSTETLHLTERYRRVSLATMIVDYTFEDPATFVVPWTRQRVWELTPGEDIREYVCNENNRYRDLVGR